MTDTSKPNGKSYTVSKQQRDSLIIAVTAHVATLHFADTHMRIQAYTFSGD